jgi:hypothetical protein
MVEGENTALLVRPARASGCSPRERAVVVRKAWTLSSAAPAIQKPPYWTRFGVSADALLDVLRRDCAGSRAASCRDHAYSPHADRPRARDREERAQGSRGAKSEAIEAEGALVFAKACALGLEGIVSKRLGSLYSSGHSR